MNTKVQKYLFITVLFFLLMGSYELIFAQSKYSIDYQQKQKKRNKPFFVKRWFFRSERKAIRKQIRKDDRQKERNRKQYLKEVKRTPKRLNNKKQAGANRKVYKRMKAYEKESERVRKYKCKDNFFKRYF